MIINKASVKRAFSWMLVMALVLGLFPDITQQAPMQAVAAASNKTIDLYSNFAKNIASEYNTTNKFWVNDTNYSNNLDSITTAKFDMVPDKQMTSDSVWNKTAKVGNDRVAWFESYYGFYTEIYDGEQLAFKVVVPGDGWYNIGLFSICRKPYPDGATVNLEVINGKGVTTKIGRYEQSYFSETTKAAFEANSAHYKYIINGYTYSDSDNALSRLTRVMPAQVYLTAGENYLVVKGTDLPSAGVKRTFGLRQFWLRAASSPTKNNIYTTDIRVNINKLGGGSTDFWVDDDIYKNNIDTIDDSTNVKISREETSDAVWNNGSRRALIQGTGVYTELYKGEKIGYEIFANREGWYNIDITGVVDTAYTAYKGAMTNVSVKNANGEVYDMGSFGFEAFSETSADEWNANPAYDSLREQGYEFNDSGRWPRLKKKSTLPVYLTAGVNTIVFEGTNVEADDGKRILGTRIIDMTYLDQTPSVELSESQLMLREGDVSKVQLKVNVAGKYIEAAQNELNVKVSGDAVKASVESDTNGAYLNITAQNCGNSKVSVSYADSNEATVDIMVAADTGNLIYEFTKGYNGAETSEKADSATGIVYEMTTVGSDAERNKLILSEPWAFYSKTGGYFRYNDDRIFNGIQNYGMGYSAGIKFKVNKAGTYYPVALIGGDPSRSQIYTQTWITDIQGTELARSEYINSSFSITPTRAQMFTADENDDDGIYFDEGEYVIYWKAAAGLPGIIDPISHNLLKGLQLQTKEFSSVPEFEEGVADVADDLVYDLTALRDRVNMTQVFMDSITYADTLKAGSQNAWKPYSWYIRTGTAVASVNQAVQFNQTFCYFNDNGNYNDVRGLSVRGNSGAISFHVPKTGYYVPKVKFGSTNAKGLDHVVDIYSLNKGKSLENRLVHSTIFSKTRAVEEFTVTNIPVYMEAGEYALVLETQHSIINELSLDAVDVSLTSDLNILSSKIGQTQADVLINIADSQGTPVDFSGGQVCAVVEDASIADFDMEIKSDGKVYYTFAGKVHGDTTVTVAAIDVNDRAYTKTIKLCVNPEGLLVGEDAQYNFKKVDNGESVTDITTVTDFAMTTAGSGVEINPAVASAPWKYISHTANYFKYEDSTNGLFLGNTNATVSFGVRLSGDSVYQLISTHTLQPNGGKVDVYLAPADSENATAEEYCMGTLDTYGATRIPNYEDKIKMKYLSRGDYVLTYKLNGAGTSLIPETRFDFTGMTFKAMDTNTVMDVTASVPNNIDIGQTVEVPITVTENSGGDRWIPNATIIASANPSDIVGLEVVSDEEGLNHVLRITANNAGTATVNITAVNEVGIVAQYNAPVLIMNTQQIATKTYIYNFIKVMNVDDSLRQVVSYAMTLSGSGEELRPGGVTDNWKYHSDNASDVTYFSDTHGVGFSQSEGQYAAISVRLPESGFFQPSITYTAQKLGGAVRMYLAPIDEENFTDDKWAVGDFDSWRSVDAVCTTALRARYLTAGEYIIAMELIKSNPNLTAVPRLWFRKIQLKPLDAYPALNISGETDITMKKGGVVNIAVSAEYADEAAVKGDATELAAELLRGAEYEVVSGGEYVAVQSGFTEENGAAITFIGLKEGSSDVEVAVKFNGEQRAIFRTNVTVDGAATLKSASTELPGYSKDTLNLRDLGQPDAVLATKLFDSDGNEFTARGIEILGGATYAYSSSDESVATVDNNGVISPVAPGVTTITLNVTLNGVTATTQQKINVALSKTGSSYYKKERVESARENIKKYDWARQTSDKVIKSAEKYLDESVVDHLWNMVSSQDLPRSYYVGYRGEAAALAGLCRYCGVELTTKYGNSYAWIINEINSPWKVQCPDCRRKFPSNDFSKFFDAGLDEYHNWSYEQAKANGSQYLTNDLYPEKGAGWGVDDGYGYDTGRVAPNGIKEVHTYIAYYNHWGVWHDDSAIHSAISDCTDAYIYTGDIKYARAGAVLLDRIADIWKDLRFGAYPDFTTDNGNYEPLGKAIDWIWENGRVQTLLEGYDAFYEVLDDPYIVNYINSKAKQYNYFGQENHKETGNQIREYLEENIVRETFRNLQNGHINGNFAMPQGNAILAGIVMDTKPETDEMFDWAFRTGVGIGGFLQHKVTGGNFNEYIVNRVDRDGQTTEVAPQYSQIWTGNVSYIIDILDVYGNEDYDLYSNPKIVKLLWSPIQTAMANGGNVAIGDDNNACGKDTMPMSTLVMGRAWRGSGDPRFAQLAYLLNGNSANGLVYDIFTENPESFATEVQQVVDTYGEYNAWKSDFLTDFGLVVLRRGEKYASAGKAEVYNTKGDFWFHYGYNGGHGHPAALNLGVEAYGLNMAPEFGYPISSGGDEFDFWGEQSLSHNLVVVDDVDQYDMSAPGQVFHLDDAGRVKIMDAEAAASYEHRGVTDYRRTVVMIEANDEVSYGIDFFRVVGGGSHMYSFHAMSDHLAEAPVVINDGAEEPTLVPLVAQKDPITGEYKGTYAGIEVDYKAPGITSGFSYLKNIDKAINPRISEFAVDFELTDFRDDITLDSTKDLHLRLSMLNDSAFEEITIATGSPAARFDNPQNLKFLLARNNDGKSLFTTVIEPYAAERYIEKTEQMTKGQLTYADGSTISSEDVVKAVKVTFVDGRIDYVFYSLDNSKEYLLTDGDRQIPFSGFVGVYTVDAYGTNIGSYLHDGTKLADVSTTDAYTGNVISFTDTLEFENFIEVEFDNAENVDIDNLPGRFIYFNKTAYGIKDAKLTDNGTAMLSVGDSTLIDSMDADENFIYHVDIGDEIRIPLSVSTDTTPVFDESDNGATVIVGHEYTSYVSATSPVGKELTYEAVSLPRGATFDAETGKINWKPDSYQAGKHHFGIRASDGDLSSVLSFTVEVYKSSSGSGNLSNITGEVKPSTPSGGGAGSTTPAAPSEPSKPSTDKDDDTPVVPDTPAEKFIDLDNHTWAKDAIYTLVEKGVVNGTSESTYSPANNIKRADFAIMLVRAFGITEGEGENFADVDASKYYAEELRLAKAAGIVNGVGNDKFNPEGEITRQDMMLMLSRALDAMEVELSDADLSQLAEFADSAQISDYAADAVSRMVKDGIIAGANGKINPLAKATRAEIAVMLDRVLAK